MIDGRRVWPNALLIATAFTFLIQDFIERPQLFSNALFAMSLLLCLRFLDTPSDDRRARRTIVWSLFGLAAFWANIHGGAALMVPLLFGTVVVQEGIDAWSIGELTRGAGATRMRWLIGMTIALIFALLLTPNLHETFTYLWLLATDKTAVFINEWNPSPWPQWLTSIGPFALIALASLITTRRHPIAVGLMLLGLGFLSRTGARHEVLFVLTCLGCTFHQLRWNERWQESMTTLERKPIMALSVTALGILMITWLHLPYHRYLHRANIAGFGAFPPAEEAADFLQEQAIKGHIFNTYTTGGYLLFRHQKVFIDGRNVDYGYDFLSRALDARYSPQTFRDLESEYQFTTAVIEHWQNPSPQEFTFLSSFDDWSLVFIDDWTAVYLKRIPEQQSLIAAKKYGILTPQLLQSGTLPEALSDDQVAILERDLRRAIAQDRRGVRALILLSKLQRARGQFEEALHLASEASSRYPLFHEPVEIQASIAAAQERWKDAAALYERTLELSEYLNLTPPYETLATVFEKAGKASKAAEFREKAGIQPEM
jgi:tetratricopeptide (TPR) repeat protein